MTVRIAMWSGPRNLSTAMMRSFGARADCAVWDEPFYAAYLAKTGNDHPMRAEILAAHETDPDKVAARCRGEAPGGKALFYQKHMTHHMLDGFDVSWMEETRSAFLIREPLYVAASYEVKWEEPTLAELGFERQSELFRAEADRLGHAPPVVDAAHIAQAPRQALEALCTALGIAFDPNMLSWAAGARPEDGIWGAHWYNAVNASTGFAPAKAAPTLATDHARRLADAARPFYAELKEFAL
ncbi:MAG: HAD family hydrolase [Pseudomonadota bacterium]